MAAAGREREAIPWLSDSGGREEEAELEERPPDGLEGFELLDKSSCMSLAPASTDAMRRCCGSAGCLAGVDPHTSDGDPGGELPFLTPVRSVGPIGGDCTTVPVTDPARTIRCGGPSPTRLIGGSDFTIGDGSVKDAGGEDGPKELSSVAEGEKVPNIEGDWRSTRMIEELLAGRENGEDG